MAKVIYYIKNKFQLNEALDHHTLKKPLFLHSLALILSAYFLIFGWQKSSRID